MWTYKKVKSQCHNYYKEQFENFSNLMLNRVVVKFFEEIFPIISQLEAHECYVVFDGRMPDFKRYKGMYQASQS
jgi:5'-3' exonuclease